jgi:hypothetical protein
MVVPSSAAPIISDQKMRPGRFELPRSKRTTRPSTLRTDCTTRPLAGDLPDSSTSVDDLDRLDAAFVVTVMSPGRPPVAPGCSIHFAGQGTVSGRRLNTDPVAPVEK